jgi:hypothetical protein
MTNPHDATTPEWELDEILNAYLSDRYDVALPSKKAYLLDLAKFALATWRDKAVASSYQKGFEEGRKYAESSSGDKR